MMLTKKVSLLLVTLWSVIPFVVIENNVASALVYAIGLQLILRYSV